MESDTGHTIGCVHAAPASTCTPAHPSYSAALAERPVMLPRVRTGHLHSPRLPHPVGHPPSSGMASDEVRVLRCGHSARLARACGRAAERSVHSRVDMRAPCTPRLTRPVRLCPTSCTPTVAGHSGLQGAGQVVALRFLVDPAAAGAILGKQGSTITECEAQSGARIQLSRSTEVRGVGCKQQPSPALS